MDVINLTGMIYIYNETLGLYKVNDFMWIIVRWTASTITEIGSLSVSPKVLAGQAKTEGRTPPLSRSNRCGHFSR